MMQVDPENITLGEMNTHRRTDTIRDFICIITLEERIS